MEAKEEVCDGGEATTGSQKLLFQSGLMEPPLAQRGVLSPTKIEAEREIYSSRTSSEQIISDQFANTIFNKETNPTIHSW